MAESSLSISFVELRREIGRYLGFDRDPANWVADQTTDVADILRSGLRQFYRPPPIEGKVHVWSFLSPTFTVVTVADDGDYDLDDNYAGTIGDMTYAADVSTIVIRRVPEPDIRRLRELNLSSNKPEVFAVRPKAVDQTDGQRFEILFHPTPDAAYTLTGRAAINPDTIDASNPYPLGGMIHAETILASCRAAAELTMNGTRGVMWDAYQVQLQSSVSHDSRFGAAEYFGYNGDSSQLRGKGLRRHLQHDVLINGTKPV